METVEVGDISLVDLYGYKGTADSGLIASALDAIAADQEQLFVDTWVIVTNNRTVEAMGNQQGVLTMKLAGLAAMIGEPLAPPVGATLLETTAEPQATKT